MQLYEIGPSWVLRRKSRYQKVYNNIPQIKKQNQLLVFTVLKGHVALDRSSWSNKSVWKRLLENAYALWRCFKSSI